MLVSVMAHRVFHWVDTMSFSLFKKRLSRIPLVHLSIDDVHDVWQEVAINYTDLWQHPFFKILFKLHKRYNAKFTLYCLTDKDIHIPFESLKLAREWLTLGFHGVYRAGEDEVGSFNKFTNACHIAGLSPCSAIRLHRFQVSLPLLKCLKHAHITTLLCSDNKHPSYGLVYSQYKQKPMLKGVTYLPSDARLENALCLRFLSWGGDPLYLFMHEGPFMRYKEWKKLDMLCQLLSNAVYTY